MTNSVLEIKNLNKDYHFEEDILTKVISDLTLSFPLSENGIITSLVAPIKAGKTTLLKILAGLVNQDNGTIKLKDQSANELSSKIIYLPQQSVSFPWLTVKENVFFGSLEPDNNVKKEKYIKIIQAVCLEGYEDYIPNSKSKGFRFRISLARAMMSNPSLIIIDDCLTDMNNETKFEVIELLKEIKNNFNQNLLLATSNISDAVYISDKIYLFNKDAMRLLFEEEIREKYKSMKEMWQSDSYKSLKQKIELSYLTDSSSGNLSFSV